MTTYRFPEQLGGGEYESIIDFGTKAGPDWRFRFSVPGVGVVDVPASALVEVLPDEPPPGFYLLKYEAAGYLFPAEHKGKGWFLSGQEGSCTWAEVVKLYPGATVIRLVADPFAEPVTLPWSCEDESRAHRTEVEVTDGEVRDVNRAVEGYAVGVLLSPDGARAKARALWAAAAAAETQR